MAHMICPWWLGYFLASPIRRFSQKPERILAPFVKEGMTVLDAGSAMGFFTIPMAAMVGEKGRVVAVDVQERMLGSLKKRAAKKGLDGIIEARLCASDSLSIDDLAERIDFALAFAVVHEVPDRDSFFSQIHRALKKGGLFLLAEPKGHVSGKDFESTVAAAERSGFLRAGIPDIPGSRACLMKKG